ncbi:MAG: glyoxylate/hydroxypyruvate reductase A [Colwellia sp.]|nr:glyoxylate/hydroxypyruvate reductase A [Colwellia sp.]
MTQQCAFISQLSNTEQQNWLDKLNAKLPNVRVMLAREMSVAEKQQCKVAVVANPKPEDLTEFPQLVWVQSLWAGVERLVAELDNPSFALSRLVDPMLATIMSEAVLAWTLYLHREMPKYMAQQKLAKWQQLDYKCAGERTIGILGLGELGKSSAQVLVKNGFTVSGWSNTAKVIDGIECFFGREGLETLISQADIIVCLLPLTPDTRKLINDDFLTKMKKGTSLINFARGAIINHHDLVKQLNRCHVGHAVLDVFEHEPLDESSVLWQHPNITILPHVSAPTHIESASKIVAQRIDNFVLTGELPECIDMVKGY